MSVGILKHHDRIIDDQTNGQHHRQQRQRVNRKPEQVKKRECTNKRHRNGDQWNQAGSDGAQEKENSQCDQQHRFANRFVNRLDRAFDKNGRVVRNHQFHA